MRDRMRAMASVAALTLALGLAGPALADPADPRRAPGQQAERDSRGDLPSADEVQDAEAAAAAKAGEVGRIKAAMLLANQRLEQAAVEAEHASEAYNGARWRLEQAGAALEQARADAAEARRAVAEQRDAIGALVASSYQQGTELTALSAMMSADGPQNVLDQYAGFQGASTSLDADYQRFAAADALAQVFETKAIEAERRRQRVAAEARTAQQQAAAAADEAQQVATTIAVEKDRLIRELAQAQDISVSLARTRQARLEEIARERAAQRARQEALAAARAQAAAEKAAAEKAAAEKAAAEKKAAQEKAAAEAAAAAAAAKAEAEKKKQAPTPPPVPEPDPQPTPRPTPPTPPTPPAPPAPPATGGADAAIAFARSQVGDPYRWGAAGPDAWDCSGLTMAAWEGAGVSLPHYSVAQFYAGAPIDAAQLRPGDLVFWSSSSSPQGIHHVALYVGDGMIVHAPRTGRPVVVESMYSWVPPTHFARL